MPDLERRSSLRIGVAGLGVASVWMMPYFATHPYLALTAAADIRPAGLAKFAQATGGEIYDSVEGLCASPNVDVVYVSSPNHLHAQHVMTAARHGKHVIVEKPMALTLAECQAMVTTAEEHGIVLIPGHSECLTTPVRKMREIVKGKTLGPLRMINVWHFNDFMFRPRAAWELDPAGGGNVVYNQAPHHVDIVRLLGGGLVRSVRAMTGTWDPARRVAGAWCSYLDFEDGTPATIVYNGYAHFDTAEMTFWTWVTPRDPASNLRTRRHLLEAPAGSETALKEAWRYGGGGERPVPDEREAQQIFGLTLVSCERGDIRQSPRGLLVYGDDGQSEIPLGARVDPSSEPLEEMYDAVIHRRPPSRDGRWGMATMEVVLGIMESARLRKEVRLEHQVPARD